MSSKLLIHESPLQVLPTLAVMIGLAEAITLQQVHYWTETIAKSQGQLPPEQRHNYKQGRWWTYQSVSDWREKSFPFWSESTVKRAFLNLEGLGILISRQLSRDKRDRTNWYAIDYDRLNQLIAEHEAANVSGTQADEQCIGSNCTDGKAQGEPMSSGQNGPMLIEAKLRDQDERGKAASPDLAPAERPGISPVDATAETETDAMVQALGDVTGMDSALNQARLAKESARLLVAGYSSQTVRSAFASGGAWYTQDWRGKKGEMPTLKNVLEQIAVLSRTVIAPPGSSAEDLERTREKVRQEMKAARKKRQANPSQEGESS